MTDGFNIHKGDKEFRYIVDSHVKTYHRICTSKTFSIKTVVSGEEFYRINRESIILKKDNFLVVNPGQQIEMEVESDVETSGRCFFFDKFMLGQAHFSLRNSIEKNLDQGIDSSDLVEFGNTPIHAHGTSLDLLLKNVDINMNLDKQQVSDLLINISEQLVRHQFNLRGQLSKLQAAKAGTRMELFKRIQLGRQCLHDQLNKKISLGQIAFNVGLSEFYFHRSFRSFFGLTPHQYLHKIRMEYAKQLQMNHKHSYAEIAKECGFKDPKYFRKVFNAWNTSN